MGYDAFSHQVQFIQLHLRQDWRCVNVALQSIPAHTAAVVECDNPGLTHDGLPQIVAEVELPHPIMWSMTTDTVPS